MILNQMKKLSQIKKHMETHKELNQLSKKKSTNTKKKICDKL